MSALIMDKQTVGADAFAQPVIDGLSQPQKTIPARHLYDRAGSESFEQFTQLPEYDADRLFCSQVWSTDDGQLES